ncbi:exo-alpha-sialidase, partial [Trypanosoma cruzi]
QQLTHTDTRNRRWKNSAPGTHSDGHHQQQEPRRVLLYSSRVGTLSNAHTKNNQRNAKGHKCPSQHPRAAASRIALVSSSSPAFSSHTAGGVFAEGSTTAETHRQVQLLEESQ